MAHDELPEFDLESYLPYRFTVLATQLSDSLAKQYKSEYGISMPEWRVLVNVAYADNPSVRDIERRVKLEKTKVSRAAAKLVEKGLITRATAPEDRRLVKFEVTDQGVQLLKHLIPLAQRFQDQLITMLGQADGAFVQALDVLEKSVGDETT